MGYKLASWLNTQGQNAAAKDSATVAFEMAQQYGFVQWEIHLLWLLSDLSLRENDLHGVNLMAYAAVRARDIGDEDKSAKCLRRLDEMLTEARSHEQSMLAQAIVERVLAVWQEPDWADLMKDLIAEFVARYA
jgi:hypothetical protein